MCRAESKLGWKKILAPTGERYLYLIKEFIRVRLISMSAFFCKIHSLRKAKSR